MAFERGAFIAALTLHGDETPFLVSVGLKAEDLNEASRLAEDWAVSEVAAAGGLTWPAMLMITQDANGYIVNESWRDF